MDFPGRRLVLRPRNHTVTGGTRVPFLLISEHYLVVPGRVNGGEPLWFFRDTGSPRADSSGRSERWCAAAW